MAVNFYTAEFQNSKGWHCMNDQDLGNNSNAWYNFPRSIGMPLDTYIEMLMKDFKPDYIELLKSEDGDVLSFAWENQAAMRKYKNWANAQYRKRK